MHYSVWGLRTTALGSSVVAFGFVLLLIAAVGVTWFVMRTRRRKTWRPAGGIEPALPAAGDSKGPGAGPGPATHLVDSEAVAAVAACLACVMDGRLGEGVGPGVLPSSLVAAITAAIIAREEVGESSRAGHLSIKVRKGDLG